ncbi:uncharacterized protein LOC144746295 [Ciona intestinalis]
MNYRRIFILFLVLDYSTAIINTLTDVRDLYLSSNEPKLCLTIKYGICMPHLPYTVSVTATHQSGNEPYTFNATVAEILESMFIVCIERTDQAMGWPGTFIQFDWSLKLGQGGINYKRSYIELFFTSGITKYNKLGSVNSCSLAGGKLVDIADKEMYDAIYNYVATTFNSGAQNFITVWTGMNYDRLTTKVTQSNGQPGYNGNWKHGTPSDHSGRNSIVIHVDTAGGLSGVGFVNTDTVLSAVPLCMYN